MVEYYKKWRSFLSEAQQDSKILRNLNIKALQKEVPQGPEEETRDYFARLQAIERAPEYLNPIFPQGLVDWIESLPDNHFPREGRKRFAKWLGNAIYFHETEERNNLNSVDNPEELNVYNNDVRYIADYLNGEVPGEIPSNFYNSEFSEVMDLAGAWHDELKRGIKYTGEYRHKEVVYEFDNGFTIVDINTEHDLEIEGDLMGHCVGGYCDDVAEGIMTIYSLRDKRNKPHATIEVTSSGFVDQIKGKGNDAPVEKYRGMIRQWLDSRRDFEYKDSDDYLNLLSNEEIKEMIVSGKLQKARVKEVMRSTESSELIEFFIGQVEAIGPVYGGSEIEPVLSIDAQVIASELARNHNFSGEQVLALAKINLNLRQPALGRQMGSLIGAGIYGPYPGPERNFSTVEVATRIWQDLGDELKQGVLDEKLYYMEALMQVGSDQPTYSDVRLEIAEHLTSEPFMEKAASIPGNSNVGIFAVYGSILQLYMKSPRADKQLVRKLYTMQRDERFVELIQAKDRLSAAAVSSPGMSDELVDEIIEDIKSGARQSLLSTHWINIITSPNVSDSKKIEMLNVGKAETRTSSNNLSGLGLPASEQDPMLKWAYSDRSMSRKFVEAARENKFSRRVVKYMIDSGMFDPHYTNLWADQQSKLKGKRPNLDSISYDGKEGTEILKKARDMALQNLRGGAYTSVQLDTVTSGDKPPWLDESNSKVETEINNYFRKNIMTKDKFYDTIKEQLEIKEEKGRSRQRGIYKFYCMISYSLTSEPDKTRGLDDILADLRALPNVTIVTVAIRNQKIAEARYIAGLSIKFIPSTPGDFNTPENVKARIVKDIKRLDNVQSLFKLSSGLIRLE
jgi:hypothetical protein